MDTLSHTESITVAASPESLYDMVSDVARMGQWSPVCKACWWEDDAGPRVGAVFVGRNETSRRTWETRSTVTAADRGAEFAWEVNGGLVRWRYTFEATEGGTLLSEHWHLLPAGVAFFREKYGAEADGEIAERTRQAHEGIPATLAAIKKSAESG